MMGRTPTKNWNLPKGMRARTRVSGNTYYYFETGIVKRKEIPLGNDYVKAIQQWSELTKNHSSNLNQLVTFKYVAERYTQEIIPTKAPRTRSDNIQQLAKLLEFFHDDPPLALERIEPVHIRQFMTWRGESAKVQANRCKALFSHIWNFVRNSGLTTLANPCQGIRGFTETGRKNYIDDEIYHAVFSVASPALKDAMDMAFLTGQRPADVLKISATHIKDDMLSVTQGKTKKTIRIRLNNDSGQRNDLGKLVDRIMTRKRKHKIADVALICGMGGYRMSKGGLDSAFDRARLLAVDKADSEGKYDLVALIKGFQFRDLRAKAATEKADSAGIEEARRQLAHGSTKMTQHYVRKGEVVTPTK